MRKRIFNISHILIAIFLLLMVKVFTEFTTRLSIFDPIQRAVSNFSILDIFYQIQDAEEKKVESPFITIVDISELHERSKIADVIYAINACNPAVIGLDVIFNGLKGDSVGSQYVANAIHEAREPIVAFKLDKKDSIGNFTCTTRSFFSPMEHVEEGYINMQSVSFGGVIREMSTWNLLNDTTVNSLSYLMARKYLEYNNIWQDSKWPKRCLINYTPTEFPIVPYDSVLYRDSLITDRIVLLGTVNDVEDMHYSPLGRTAGSIIQAYAIQTLIEHHHIKEVTLWLNILITFVLLIITSMAQQEISYRAIHSKYIVLRFFFQTDIINNVMNFVWMLILMGINYVIVFKYYNIYFNPTIMLVCIVMLVEVRQSYDLGEKMYKEHKRSKHIKNLKKDKSKI